MITYVRSVFTKYIINFHYGIIVFAINQELMYYYIHCPIGSIYYKHAHYRYPIAIGCMHT